MLQQVLDFLTELKNNNHKEWFEDHRSDYQAAKQYVEELVSQVLQALAQQDTTLVHLRAKDCMFRINRDVRFSKDKSPYKTNMGAYIAKGGKKSVEAGYYLHLEPNNCFLAGGLYMPSPDLLTKVRQEIDYSYNEFLAIVQHPQFVQHFGELQGESLKTFPKGYAKDHPALPFLRMKSLIAQHTIPTDILQMPNLAPYTAHIFSILTPFNHFLNQAID